MKTKTIVVGMLMMACGDVLDRPIEEEEEEEQAAPLIAPLTFTQEEHDAFRAEREAEHGVIEVNPDHEQAVEGEMDMYDHVDDSGEEVDKTSVVAAHGFAWKGTLVMQSIGNNPQAHCERFNIGCDNQIHSQLDDLTIDNMNDANWNMIGRCGRFDDGLDASFKPCIIPYANKTANGKRWKWRWDPNTCPSNAVGRGVLLWGIESALADIDLYTDISFVQTTVVGDENILFECSGLPGTALALGMPKGDLTLSYAADQIAEEVCDDASGTIPPTDGTGNYTYYFADMMYSYRKGSVQFDWSDFWNFSDSCTTDGTTQGYIARSIALHELGHIFGWVHQNWTDPRPGFQNVSNVMKKVTTCSIAKYRNQHWHPRMMSAMNDIDFPRVSLPGEILDEDISCLFPL